MHHPGTSQKSVAISRWNPGWPLGSSVSVTAVPDGPRCAGGVNAYTGPATVPGWSGTLIVPGVAIMIGS